MNLGFIAALVIGTLAILGVFIDIPLIGEVRLLGSRRRLFPARWRWHEKKKIRLDRGRAEIHKAETF
jgi:hypothetical protein